MKKNEMELSKEWMKLVELAMNANITKDEFRIFLEKQKVKKANN